MPLCNRLPASARRKGYSLSTVAEVAALAGVSPSTVSRVLSGKALTLVSDATQVRVRDAAARLGYRPSAAARALATGRAATIAFCCYHAYDSGMSRLLRAVHDLATEAGYYLLLVHPKSTDDVARLLIEERADAVVWVRYPVHEADALMPSRGAPHQVVVAIGETQDDRAPEDVFSVAWDDGLGMRQILQHLTSLGHRDITFLQGHAPATNPKVYAFKRACQALGLPCDTLCCADESDRIGAGMAMAQRLLRRRQRPTALVARVDDFAFGAIYALQEAGLAVPADMSVVGYHNTPEAAHFHPPLTSVRTPELQGVAALMPTALAALDRGPDELVSPACLRLETDLIVRNSTGPARGNTDRERG